MVNKARQIELEQQAKRKKHYKEKSDELEKSKKLLPRAVYEAGLEDLKQYKAIIEATDARLKN